MPRTTQNLMITSGDDSMERLVAREVGGLIKVARPWLVGGLAFGAGWLAHHLWGHMPAVPWAAIALVLSTIGLAVFTYAVSRLAPVGRAHSCASVATAGMWLTISTITGPGAPVTSGIIGIFGAAGALSWNIRDHVRKHGGESNTGTAAGKLSQWFADAAKEVGMSGTTLQVKAIEPTRAEATAHLEDGKTVADLNSRIRNIESSMGVPPGTLTPAEDPDRADRAKITVSDPRLIRNPVPHPGPSRPGGSIADPLRTGIWQDGVPVQHTITGHHVHVMGSSGSGKSEGACWCYSAEIITRIDAAILAADITKANQTWGPLEPALHRVEYTRDGVRDMLNTLHKLVPKRSEYLGDHGLTKWVPGCGLTYLIPWLEETPDIYDKLTSKEQDNWLSDVKALRSAGGTWFVSLQRSDWSQIPTIVRGQMASLCFGLYKSSDERFGLSEKQQEMGCSPSSWGTDHPGMAHLHYPSPEADRIAMPMRHYAWGDLSSKERHDATAAAAMAAYAAQYPASERPVDEMTAAITGGPRTPVRPAAAAPAAPARPVAVITRPQDTAGRDDDEDQDYPEDENVLDEYLTTEDPNPALGDADIDDPIEDQPGDEAFEFDAPEPVDPQKAREIFTEHLAGLRADGKTTLAARDFRSIMRPGMGRAWIHARLNEAVERGELEHDRDDGTYQFPAEA